MSLSKLDYYMDKCKEQQELIIKIQNKLEKYIDNTRICFVTKEEYYLFHNEDNFNIEINKNKIVEEDIKVRVSIFKVPLLEDQINLPMEGI